MMENLQVRTLEWVARALLQGIFPTQGWNPSLPHRRRILHHLSHQGSPNKPEKLAVKITIIIYTLCFLKK